MLGYFEFLINHFDESNLAECSKIMIDDSKSPEAIKSSLDKQFLFFSNEAVFKMSKICAWFLERENESELYDDKNQHCDILEKLKYSKTRFDFLKNSLRIHSKLSSLGFKRELNEAFRKNFGKLLSTVTSSNSFMSQLGIQLLINIIILNKTMYIKSLLIYKKYDQKNFENRVYNILL